MTKTESAICFWPNAGAQPLAACGINLEITSGTRGTDIGAAVTCPRCITAGHAQYGPSGKAA